MGQLKHHTMGQLKTHMDGLDGVEVTNLIKGNIYKKTLIFAYTGDKKKSTIQIFKNIG